MQNVLQIINEQMEAMGVERATTETAVGNANHVFKVDRRQGNLGNDFELRFLFTTDLRPDLGRDHDLC